MTYGEAVVKLFRMWDKHPYQQTLSDYHEELRLMRIIETEGKE